jgi:hypothetical protein
MSASIGFQVYGAFFVIKGARYTYDMGVVDREARIEADKILNKRIDELEKNITK